MKSCIFFKMKLPEDLEWARSQLCYQHKGRSETSLEMFEKYVKENGWPLTYKTPKDNFEKLSLKMCEWKARVLSGKYFKNKPEYKKRILELYEEYGSSMNIFEKYVNENGWPRCYANPKNTKEKLSVKMHYWQNNVVGGRICKNNPEYKERILALKKKYKGCDEFSEFYKISKKYILELFSGYENPVIAFEEYIKENGWPKYYRKPKTEEERISKSMHSWQSGVLRKNPCKIKLKYREEVAKLYDRYKNPLFVFEKYVKENGWPVRFKGPKTEEERISKSMHSWQFKVLKMDIYKNKPEYRRKVVELYNEYKNPLFIFEKYVKENKWPTYYSKPKNEKEELSSKMYCLQNNIIKMKSYKDHPEYKERVLNLRKQYKGGSDGKVSFF